MISVIFVSGEQVIGCDRDGVVGEIKGWLRRVAAGYMKPHIVENGSPQSSCLFTFRDRIIALREKITQQVTCPSGLLEVPTGSTCIYEIQKWYDG